MDTTDTTEPPGPRPRRRPFTITVTNPIGGTGTGGPRCGWVGNQLWFLAEPGPDDAPRPDAR